MPETETNRNGLQVTFNKIGEEPNVLDETNYAYENVDNFYVMTHVVVETLAKNDNHQPEYWDLSYSRIGTASMGNVTVVSFCYASLNINDIKEVQTVTNIEIFAKVCEMLLILVVGF
ncbi:predicted protein [Naegleria gruberi]|uniref:Predicted protein n=1 Tax=Naegleria gruberi TaxID=5762 RepID=D2V014_NAEGR|nr:uncharacterized protein NAEGRDRAFT_62134 [Naegleria gruberi]EFC49448.1 predicted protein [Naegleria gruberi]|eukprot:XP_002682192.1 predicted protein [Naegleria gruberi strain NEG-M]